MHGVLMDIYGVGVVLLGKSGVGKSECALDLIARGHRLVSDDLILMQMDAAGDLLGSAPEITKHYIEVRGLGILNVFQLYGAASVRDTKKVDLALELISFEDISQIDRLGLQVYEKEILGKKIPLVRVPCWKGRNLTTIIEIAARNQILKWAGHDSAVGFEKKHKDHLCEP